MTRREEIINNIGYKMTRAALEYVEKHEFADAMDAFEAGAEWMQETMIEKACEYLRQSLYNTPIFEHDEDETPVNYVCVSCCDSVEEFVENFRRAMEE